MTIKLGKVERINVRDAWPNEASHFTPWLASEEGLELLQEVLGMDLEVEATEKFVGPFKADILAKRTDTTDDHWVLIENQLEKTDHRHLGQLLTYAAGLDAATIVWVAESFAEEHRAALDWLNDITSDEFEFFGLEIELWQIAGSPPAPMINVIAQPNEWSREVKRSADGTVPEIKQLQQRYWNGLRSKLMDAESVVRPPKAPLKSRVRFGIGKSDTWMSACVNSQRKDIWIEFVVRGPSGKAWFDQLFAQREEIESELGVALDWQRMDGNKKSHIALRRPDTDFTQEADWPAQHEWLVDTLERFRGVFRPRVLALSEDDGAATGEAEEDDRDLSEVDD